MAKEENTTPNYNSILVSIKNLLGIIEDNCFDADIILHINSVLANLTQMGVGPKTGFTITGEEEEWSDFISDSLPLIQNVKSYVYIKVRMVFDPPSSSIHKEALENQCKEFEWRIYSEINYHKEVDQND